MSEDKEQKKFVPSLSQILKAAKSLPLPDKSERASCAVIVDSDAKKSIEFEKIKLIKADGEKSAKWSYKGRIFIDSRYTNYQTK